jgi:hypothetical protein
VISTRQIVIMAAIVVVIGSGLAVAAAPDDDAPLPPNMGRVDPVPAGEKVTLGGGQVGGAGYTVRGFTTQEGNVCLEVVGGLSGGVTGSCAAPLSNAKPTATMTDESPNHAERLVVGLADEGLDAVTLKTEKGQRPLKVRAKDGFGPKWFATTVDGDAGSVDIEAGGSPAP